nr:Crp/Fnr family transcriptional regulator [uncultured Cohaesibacter sp.]
MKTKSFIKNMPWLDEPASELEGLFVEHGVRHCYSKDQVFKHSEESNEYIYYLKEGFCYNFTVNSNGTSNINRLLTPGSIFGEVSCVLGAPSLTQTTAVEDSVVYTLKYRNLLTLVAGDADLLHSLLKAYAWRIGAYNISIFVKNTFSNEQKIALLFISICNKSDQGNFRPIPFSLTHQLIGELVGVSRETVSRVLSKWKKSEMIRTGRSIEINIEKMQEVLEH